MRHHSLSYGSGGFKSAGCISPMGAATPTAMARWRLTQGAYVWGGVHYLGFLRWGRAQAHPLQDTAKVKGHGTAVTISTFPTLAMADP